MTVDVRHRLYYVVSDYVMTSLAWFLFNIIRYYSLDEVNYASSLTSYLRYPDVMLGQLLVPFMMLGLYWLSGFYNKTFSKSRLEVLASTLGSILLGIILIYFVVIIDDPIPDRYSNYVLLLILGGLFLLLVTFGRLIITGRIFRLIARRLIFERVVVVGKRRQVLKCIERFDNATIKSRYVVAGVVVTDNEPIDDYELLSLENMSSECHRLGVDKIILAVDSGDSDEVFKLIRLLYVLNLPVMLPLWSAGAILSRVKVKSVAGEPLADIASVGISESQRNLKRLFDVVISVLAIIILFPFMILIALLVKYDSKGPVIFSQERVGLHRVPFSIYKFRTMCVDAELSGPALSDMCDPRITALGRFLRKYRLDELPQFWNVLKGDMSLVGPRPEREYYESQILERAPYYTLVHQMRPGITSWGMVKFGYASSVDQMVERLAYDMIYLENVSIMLDIKILFFTLRTVVTGKGV